MDHGCVDKIFLKYLTYGSSVAIPIGLVSGRRIVSYSNKIGRHSVLCSLLGLSCPIAL